MKNAEKWTPTKFKKSIFGYDSGYNSIGSYLVIKNQARALSSLQPIFKNAKRVLDLGCGSMPHYIFFKHLKPADFIGVDWPNSIHNISHADFEYNILDFNWEHGQFDCILAMDVFEHTGCLTEFFKKIHEKLPDNGVFVFNVPFMYWIHESPHDKLRYTEFFIKENAETSGFIILREIVIGGSFMVILDTFSKVILSRLKLNIWPVKKIILFLSDVLLKVFNDSRKFPIQYFYVLKKQG